MNKLQIIFVSFVLSGCATLNKGSSKDPIISWSQEPGVSRLENSNHKVDFFPLANQFEGQTNKVFCGPATMAIVLNAMRVRRGSVAVPEDRTQLSRAEQKNLPVSKDWSPFYPRYTQNSVFAKIPKAKMDVLGRPKTVKGKKTNDMGFQLRQLHAGFEAHGVKSDLRVVDDKFELAKMKSEMIQNLKSPGDYVVVNYARKGMNQEGGGHISPVGAYDSGTDSFLILDVTPTKADWVWVRSDTLLAAMKTLDTVENRGYLLISGN